MFKKMMSEVKRCEQFWRASRLDVLPYRFPGTLYTVGVTIGPLRIVQVLSPSLLTFSLDYGYL